MRLSFPILIRVPGTFPLDLQVLIKTWENSINSRYSILILAPKDQPGLSFSLITKYVVVITICGSSGTVLATVQYNFVGFGEWNIPKIEINEFE